MCKDREIFAGKVIISGSIRTLTGLHIGGEESAIESSRVGNIILRDKITGKPYIPGSVLRGKLRWLLELRLGKEQNWSIRRDEQGKHVVRIHVCVDHDDQDNRPPTYVKDEEFANTKQICPVCWIFGLPATVNMGHSTRLYVDDCYIEETEQSATETKWEAVIDRINSSAVPRQIERVPRNAIFPLSLYYELYQQEDGKISANDIDRFFDLLTLLVELEDYYVGGSGSRGSGSIRFENFAVYWKPRTWYEQEKLPDLHPISGQYTTPIELVKNFDTTIKPKLLGVEN